MQASISKAFRTITHKILGFTLYEMMLASHDFEDVKAALNDRTDWSIDLASTSATSFRSCFTIHLNNGGYFFTSCMFFLATAESMRVHYGRLSPAELKERAELIGYAAFATLFAVLDVGFVVVRVAGLVAVSGSPALATSLVFVSMSPLIALQFLTYPVRFLKRKKHESAGEIEKETGTVIDGIGN